MTLKEKIDVLLTDINKIKDDTTKLRDSIIQLETFMK